MRPAYLSLLGVVVLATSGTLAAKRNSTADLPKHAVESSELTLPRSHPFHIKLRVREATNPDNDEYNGEIEEYWAAPDKWRRIVKTTAFSQTLIVNGSATEEQLTGSYYPNWMRTLVAAALDPGAALEGVDMSKSSDNPDFSKGLFCRRFGYRVGLASARNTVFASYCFRKKLLDSVGKPGYQAEYKHYEKFGHKRVANEIREYIEPGTELSATIVELSKLKEVDNLLFEVHQQTPPIQTLQVSEETLRTLALNPPEMQWPPVRGGKTAGLLSIYVCLDTAGHVRETYGLNSDHPDMTDAARQQVSGWTFTPTTAKGEPAQVESILTFAYQTKVEDAYPVLPNEEARRRVMNLAEPHFPANTPRGTVVSVRVLVSEEGKVMTIGNVSGGPLGPVVEVVEQWRFQPYTRDGKPTAFNADITFTVR